MMPTTPGSIDTEIASTKHRRLRRIANYQSFRPEAMACCSLPMSSSSAPSSLGALAGPEGLAVFRWNEPHVPVWMLSHVTSTTASRTSLAFSQPETVDGSTEPRYLAVARGAGILVWDLTETHNPLQRRLGMGSAASSSSSIITSMTWCATAQTVLGNASVVATTATTAGLWDLRQAGNRPSRRFADTDSAAPYRQIAVPMETEDRLGDCAILDAAGVVRIYDLRMSTDHPSARGTVHAQFQACHGSGIGLSAMPLRPSGRFQRTQGWTTWGLDAISPPNTSADAVVVKVWMPGEDPGEYRLLGQCTSRHLACARVCPGVDNTLLTMGFRMKAEEHGASVSTGWNAHVWKLQFHSTDINRSDEQYGDATESTLERMVSFHGPNDAPDDLASALGRNELKSLLAADVSLGISTDDDSPELILCCLTENGFVTTHAIPEVQVAVDQRLDSQRTRRLDEVASMGTVLPFGVGSSTKLFPLANSDSLLQDAALPWTSPSSGEAASIGIPTPVDRRSFLERRPVQPSLTTNVSLLGNESGIVSMDRASLYSSSGFSPGGTDLASPLSLPIENRDTKDLSRHSSVVMDQIETDRIPCPRLCGASFSSGVGGLAVFNNGDVKRMWRWWEKSDRRQLASVPGLIGEPSLNDTLGGSFLLDAKEDPTTPFQKISAVNYPRTLKDLLDMTEAAREAKWGEQGETEAFTSEFPVIGSDFFDDDSGDSSDSEEDQDDEGLPLTNPVNPANIPSVALRGKTDVSKDADGITTGAASDILAPIVKVSNEFNVLSLNNQNPALALGWKLGDFDLSYYEQSYVDAHHRPSKSIENAPFVDSYPSSKQVLPSYRSLLPSSQDSKIRVPRSREKLMDYETVHGGEYSVRPNMQESMVFLRKLFTQQQHQEGHTPYPNNLLSPPDDPMRPIKNKPIPKLKSLGSPVDVAPPMPSSMKRPTARRGVYTIPADDATNDAELEHMAAICSHNADVCASLGETVKMETWNWVSQLCRMKWSGRGFDGWSSEGALGVGLVRGWFRYYESLGDVQMLSSLVCVLRNKRIAVKGGMVSHREHEWQLLPPDPNFQYDLYIRQYAELLYGWGLLTQRAELLQHLSSSAGAPDRAFCDELYFDMECLRCTGSTHLGHCRSCNDFSFRCSICDNAVRGQFTFCDRCCHGGHVTHITDWFQQNHECPTGCGCICIPIEGNGENAVGVHVLQ